jgi:hypothetical protein
VDVTKGGEQPQPTPDYIYFAVNNLAEIFERAKEMNCLCKDRYHDQQAGEILKRPWGEVSFYVEIRGAMGCALSMRRLCLREVKLVSEPLAVAPGSRGDGGFTAERQQL